MGCTFAKDVKEQHPRASIEGNKAVCKTKAEDLSIHTTIITPDQTKTIPPIVSDDSTSDNVDENQAANRIPETPSNNIAIEVGEEKQIEPAEKHEEWESVCSEVKSDSEAGLDTDTSLIESPNKIAPGYSVAALLTFPSGTNFEDEYSYDEFIQNNLAVTPVKPTLDSDGNASYSMQTPGKYDVDDDRVPSKLSILVDEMMNERGSALQLSPGLMDTPKSDMKMNSGQYVLTIFVEEFFSYCVDSIFKKHFLPD
jgi:hypothetical protein